MTGRIVESVPNFSEGRNEKVVESIADCFRGGAGVKLVGYESDYDHNRSVFTVVGEPEAVGECVIQAVGVAAKRIDLKCHSGQHPRIGAADVVPFIPVKNMSMAEAVELSKHVGYEIQRRWSVPVYLYEHSASAEHRRNLAEVRKGGFEGLCDKMKDPLWVPDYGKCPHVSAGASAVGAREYLIAYNINLNTDNVDAAKQIAAKIRFSGGGLKNCKALGLYLASVKTAQVSINLTDYNITGLYDVFTQVQLLASQMGIGVKNSELIGYVPANAMADAAAKFLRMDNYSRVKVLENNL